eukprot:TCALIF_00630-PA protein Name:"Similar to CEP85 Centrosomal protein of 85 kDa (Homo sapiens)" AED:0.09 eAED:0.09 QI:0/0.75/0.55/1/1/1/9/88/730
MSSTRSLSIGTYNVHMWTDENCQDNLERVQDIIKIHAPDVLCLQESTKPEHDQFSRKMEFMYPHSIWQFCTAIFSKFPLEKTLERFKDHYVIGKVMVPHLDTPIYITCLHLNHRSEQFRLAQIDHIHKTCETYLKDQNPLIWTGDFNALSRDEYTESHWAELSETRRKNAWESPHVDVTNKIKSLGFHDLWMKAGEPKPVGTCRFGTRIDYVYASPGWMNLFQLVSVDHVDSTASDHRMVMANQRQISHPEIGMSEFKKRKKQDVTFNNNNKPKTLFNIDGASPYAPLEEGPLGTPSPLVFEGGDSVKPGGMERKMELLQTQVQSLTQMLETRLGPSDPSSLMVENERLSRENADLRRNIRESDDRLTKLQESVVQLQEEYQDESEELLAQVSELTTAWQDEKLERLKVQQVQDKLIRGKQGLEAYLNTLPSQEEHDSLKATLKAQEDLCQTLKGQLSKAQIDTSALRQSLAGTETTISSLESKLEDNEILVKSLQQQVSKTEERRKCATNMDQSRFETALEELDDLKSENLNLKRYVKILQNRHKRELTKVQTSLTEMSKNFEAKTKESVSLADKLRDETKTAKYLRECLTNTKAKVIALEAKSGALASELDTARSQESYAKEQNRLIKVIHREICDCVKDLRILGSVTNQILDGDDPNVSILLGIKDLDQSSPLGSLSDLSTAQSVDFLRSQIKSLRDVRREVQEIRGKISDKYAENIGSNMTSCITQ